MVAALNPLRWLDLGAASVVARHLSARDIAALMAADPSLAPALARPLERRREQELGEAMRAELDLAMRTWPYLLNGIPGAEGMVDQPIPACPGYFAVSVKGALREATPTPFRWAKKLVRLPGWPNTVWTTIVAHDHHANRCTGSVSVDFADELDMADCVPTHMACLEFVLPQYTLDELLVFEDYMLDSPAEATMFDCIVSAFRDSCRVDL